jgi:hypothetical protein
VDQTKNEVPVSLYQCPGHHRDEQVSVLGYAAGACGLGEGIICHSNFKRHARSGVGVEDGAHDDALTVEAIGGGAWLGRMSSIKKLCGVTTYHLML